MEKIYKCACGREFKSGAALGGHRSQCKIHCLSVGKPLDQLKKEQDIRHVNNHNSEIHKIKREKKEKLKQIELEKWIAEKHKCEKCGKVMTEKFHSGRFCSWKCANSRIVTEEQKRKTSESVKKTLRKINPLILIEEQEKLYYKNPRRCEVCNAIIPFDKRFNLTCSKKCGNILSRDKISKVIKQRIIKAGGNLNKYGVRGTALYGTYKGIHCDSSWELAFVIYCLDHNIKIERNKQGFKYIYNNKGCMYYPDFIINGDTYIEIKNYITPQVEAKRDQMPKDISYKLITGTDMNKYLEYAKSKYGSDYIKLYDKDKPHKK